MILDKLKAKFSKPNPILNNPLPEEFTVRTYNILKRQGITTVGDLVKLSWNDIAKMRRSTRKTCEEVERVLEGLGLELRKE